MYFTDIKQTIVPDGYINTEGILEKTVEEIELGSSENDSVPIPKHCWNITTQHAVNVLMPDSVDYVDREIDRRYLEEEDDEDYVPVRIVDELKKELKEEVKKKEEELKEIKAEAKKREEEAKKREEEAKQRETKLFTLIQQLSRKRSIRELDSEESENVKRICPEINKNCT